MLDKEVTCFIGLQEYHVSDKQEKTAVVEKPVEVKEVENPQEAGSVEAVVEKIVEETTPVAPAVAQESSEVSPPPAEESAEESTEEQSSGNVEDNSGNEDAAEKTPEIKVTFTNHFYRIGTQVPDKQGWHSFNVLIFVLLFSSLKLLQQISVFQPQIKPGIALPDTLNIIGELYTVDFYFYLAHCLHFSNTVTLF